jgi:hypothetical protein
MTDGSWTSNNPADNTFQDPPGPQPETDIRIRSTLNNKICPEFPASSLEPDEDCPFPIGIFDTRFHEFPLNYSLTYYSECKAPDFLSANSEWLLQYKLHPSDVCTEEPEDDASRQVSNPAAHCAISIHFRKARLRSSFREG